MVEASDAPLNLKQVAHQLGVHYMTAYRYVRQGRLAAERSGTEWRVRPDVLAAFQATDSRGVATAPAASWATRLQSCMLAADEAAAWGVVEAALGAGRTPQYCYTEVLTAAVASIDEQCAAGELAIADQHVANAMAMRLIAHLGARFRRRGRARGTFVFGAPSGDLHGVPIAITADLVRLGGYDVLELGMNVPAEVFASATARAARLTAVGIGVSDVGCLAEVRTAVDAVRAVDRAVTVFVGGAAATELQAMSIEGVSEYALDGADALRILDEALARQTGRQPT